MHSCVCPRPRQRGQAGRATPPSWPTLQRDWSDSRCAGARGGGLTSAQVAVLLGPPAVSQPPPASPLLPEPFPRLCHAGDSRLHPARLETVTFSADCRGCRHTGLAWPRAYRGASSPAVCLGETPAPLHGAGGRGVSGAWPGIVEMPGVWMQRGPWRCGVQGEGLGENLPAPCPSPSHITWLHQQEVLLSCTRRPPSSCLSCSRVSAVPQQPYRTVAPESLHFGSRAS